MKRGIVFIVTLYLISLKVSCILAQTTSVSSFLVAHPFADRTVFYNLSDTGIHKPITWGLDVAWLSEGNIRRGMAFMGADRVDVIRSSFTPTAPLINGELPAKELALLNERLDLIDLVRPTMDVMLNCDHPTVDEWYSGNPARWAELIDVTTRLHEERGHTVVTVSPFNEPDYGWGQGTITDFYAIAGALKQNPRFDSIRISGGNTLNTDEANYWYNFLKDRLDEGNTHQLAGSFDNYASFHQTVQANGHHGTNDELHNVMEAMVGVEYGMKTGVWWGTAELARGEFVKASDGKRLAYAEHRSNWTAASVYRRPDGKVQLFGGTSERQAITTSYRFISKDRDVYYNGYGPQREYILEMPGGNGYQQGQTNAERVVNITWGDDIQPVIDGQYVLVNKKSGLVLEVAGGAANAGANIQQGTATGADYQKWNVTPVSARIGGDFSYFIITANHSGKAIDVYDWSLDDGSNLVVWDNVKGGNQQWYLDYANDGWFYIRSRHSALCLEVADASESNGANIVQGTLSTEASQQWRFLPVDAVVEFDPPSAPSALKATANQESIQLSWAASPEADVTGYTVLRAEIAGGPYNTIARGVTTLSFVDNTTTEAGQYYYIVRAEDYSLNRSVNSKEVSATVAGQKDLLASFKFETNTLDSSVNLNHGAMYGAISFVEGKTGKAIALNGKDAFVQLPYTLANQEEITITAWVYWNGGAPWQRIFEFSNNAEEFMYLTPLLRFSIKNNDGVERMETEALPLEKWSHVAVTIGASNARLYLNGELVDSSTTIDIRPIDFKPVLNFIGRGANKVPLFNGNIDDFMVYNYALSSDDIEAVFTTGSLATSVDKAEFTDSNELKVWPVPAKDKVFVRCKSLSNLAIATIEIVDINGRVVTHNKLNTAVNKGIDISGLPTGVYLVKVISGEQQITKKLVVNH